MSVPLTFERVFERFIQVLNAVTVPCDGGRQVLDMEGGIALSDATNGLFKAIVVVERALWAQYGRVAESLPVNIAIHESDSPDGPFDVVPVDPMNIRVMSIGGSGVPALLAAAINRAKRTTAFDSEVWNRLQAVKPGGPHQRFRMGDVISTDELEILKSVSRLVALEPRLGSIDVTDPGAADAAIVNLLFAPASRPTIPEMSDVPGVWCSNKEAADQEGIATESLARDRSPEEARWTADDKMSGIDKRGRMWRRQGTPTAHPKYLVASLRSRNNK